MSNLDSYRYNLSWWLVSFLSKYTPACTSSHGEGLFPSNISLFLIHILKQYIYVQYRAFIPPQSSWMMDRGNIIISLAPGDQIIVVIVINVVIKSHSCFRLRNQKHSPFPCVLVYCCCEDTLEGQVNRRKDWLLFPVKVFTVWSAGICLSVFKTADVYCMLSVCQGVFWSLNSFF